MKGALLVKNKNISMIEKKAKMARLCINDAFPRKAFRKVRILLNINLTDEDIDVICWY